ncbi:MAG: pseudouridine synthase [Rhizobiales bacterium]|nr:pseudouridine synthase [Hyphomicrobiales bacterium]
MDDKTKKMRGDKRRPASPSTRKGAKRGGGRPISSFAGEMPARGRAPAREGGAVSGEVSQASERIAKRLARAGISSRREAEALIAAGRVRVNGAVLSSPAFNVGPGDRIEVDGTPIPVIERTRLFLFHKPAGVVTTNRDPEGRRTVFDCLPEGLPRLMTVGRLDINTEGLLLLTNDGGLARVLELPSTGWLRRYRARVHGTVDAEALAGLSQGIAIDGVFYGAVEAALDREQGSNAWLTLGLREGKNREVKNILGALGLDVTRLIRISYGPFQLGELGEGEVLELKGRLLRDQLGERLIEESGANFEAPVTKPFPNRPVRAGNEPKAPAPRSAAPRVEEGGLVRNRKRTRERQREEALDRLQTARPPRFGDKRAEKRPDDKKKETPARPRSSNVWMAPGARPVGKGGLSSPRQGEMSPPGSGPLPARRQAPATAGAGKGRAPARKKAGKPGGPTPPPASGRTLPPRGREKPAPRKPKKD